MITGVKDILGIAIGAILATGAYFILNHLFFYPQQQTIGRESYIAEQLVQDKKNELKRQNDDEKIRGLSDYDVCIEYLQSNSDSSLCSSLR